MRYVKRKGMITMALAAVVLGLLAVGAVAFPSGGAADAHSRSHTAKHHKPVNKHNSTKPQHNGLTISVSPSAGNPGDSFVINGSGFTPKGAVSVSVGQLTAVPATADALGHFHVTLTAPGTPGQYHVLALDQSTSNSVSAIYSVNGPATSNPRITVFPTTVNPNDTITVTGSGFTPNKTVEVSTPNGGMAMAVLADAHGNISAQLAAAAIPGDYRVTALDQTTGATATARYSVR